jgi:hypothetical protein
MGIICYSLTICRSNSFTDLREKGWIFHFDNFLNLQQPLLCLPYLLLHHPILMQHPHLRFLLVFCRHLQQQYLDVLQL